MAISIEARINQVIQEHHGAILGYLVRICGNFDDAEDLCQEVMLSAFDRWQSDDMPDNPRAWLFKAAKNRMIDHHRYHAIRDTEEFDESTSAQEDSPNFLNDDMLRLIFTCCHPAIASDVRVALTLRSMTGLTLEQVARAFLVSPAAMEQRLVRAKRKIKSAGIAYEIPEGKQLDLRLISVMQTLYLLFNEGYSPTSGEKPVRRELIQDAIRLTTLLQRLLPERAELMSLLALMLLQHSRTETRIDHDGGLVLLEHQNRDAWDHRLIQQGLAILDKALYLRQAPGIYQIQASIAALHAEAANYDATDWEQIALLYAKLLENDYSPVLHLNFAVAIAMTGELDRGLTELDTIETPLANYFPYYCARGDFNLRLDKLTDSMESYQKALALDCNETERAFVENRLNNIQTKLKENR